MATPNPDDTRQNFKDAVKIVKDIEQAAKDDVYLNAKEKKDVGTWVYSKREESVEHRQSFTFLKRAAHTIFPRAQPMKREYANADKFSKSVNEFKGHFESLSEGAKQRALLQYQRGNLSDTALADSSAASGDLTRARINKKLYNVAADGGFTYNSVPSLIDNQQSRNNISPGYNRRASRTPLALPSADSPSTDFYYGSPDPVQVPVGFEVGYLNDSGNYTSGRPPSRQHRHYRTPSESSHMSVPPPRAPSRAAIIALPPPPRKREVRAVKAPANEVFPSPSYSQWPSGRYTVDTDFPNEQREGDSYDADTERLHWDNQSINVPRDHVGLHRVQEHPERTYSAFWSMGGTEEETSYDENVDQVSE